MPCNRPADEIGIKQATYFFKLQHLNIPYLSGTGKNCPECGLFLWDARSFLKHMKRNHGVKVCVLFMREVASTDNFFRPSYVRWEPIALWSTCFPTIENFLRCLFLFFYLEFRCFLDRNYLRRKKGIWIILHYFASNNRWTWSLFYIVYPFELLNLIYKILFIDSWKGAREGDDVQGQFLLAKLALHHRYTNARARARTLTFTLFNKNYFGYHHLIDWQF